MNRISFSIFLVLTVQLWISSEASCLPRNKVQILCEADFAVVTQVKGKMTKKDLESEIKYRVDIKEVFKGGDGVNIRTKFLFGVAPVFSISIVLDVGETYLVTGQISQGNPKFTNCEMVQPWNTVSDEDKQLLLNHNASDC